MPYGPAASDVSDTGGLHTGGTAEAAMRWQNNYVANVVGVGTDAAGVEKKGVASAGFYPDTGSNHQTFVGNIVASSQQYDALSGMFDNEILSNLLIGTPQHSQSGAKVRSFAAYATRTAGTLTVNNNFAYTPQNQSSKYAGQEIYGGIPILVHSANLEADKPRIHASGNTFISTRSLSTFECGFIQSRVNALAPYMRPEYCAKVASDLAYLNCGIIAPAHCDTLSSVGVSLVTPAAPLCTLAPSPSSIAKGGSATLSWTSQHVDAFSFVSPAGLNATGTSGSVTVTPTTTTTYLAQAYGPGGMTSCSTTVTVQTATGAISGRVYLDSNPANYSYDSGENTFAGRVVTLTGPVSTSTVTDTGGVYRFSNLTAGVYRVTHAVPMGYVRATDDSAPVTLASETSQETLDFGLRPAPSAPASPTTGSISGVVFTDTNRNLYVDAGEPVWSGRTVTLIGTSQTYTATTNSAGKYTFSAVPFGTYRVWHIVPDGYTRTTDNSYYPVELSSGTLSQTFNFGFAPLAQ